MQIGNSKQLQFSRLRNSSPKTDEYTEYAAKAEGRNAATISVQAASFEPERKNPQEGQMNRPKQPESHDSQCELHVQQLSRYHLHEEQLCEHHMPSKSQIAAWHNYSKEADHTDDKRCQTIGGDIPAELLRMLLAAEQAVQNYSKDLELANPGGTRTPFPYRTQDAGSETAAQLK